MTAPAEINLGDWLDAEEQEAVEKRLQLYTEEPKLVVKKFFSIAPQLMFILLFSLLETWWLAIWGDGFWLLLPEYATLVIWIWMPVYLFLAQRVLSTELGKNHN